MKTTKPPKRRNIEVSKPVHVRLKDYAKSTGILVYRIVDAAITAHLDAQAGKGGA